MADRGDAADGLASPGSDRPGVRPAHRQGAHQRRHLARIHPVGTAGHDEQRRPVRAKDQAVGDRTQLAAELGRGGRRRGRGFGQLPDLARHALVPQHGSEFGEVDRHGCRLAGPRPPGEPLTATPGAGGIFHHAVGVASALRHLVSARANAS